MGKDERNNRSADHLESRPIHALDIVHNVKQISKISNMQRNCKKKRELEMQ